MPQFSSNEYDMATPYRKIYEAWSSEEPIVEKELSKPEPKPYPWKAVAVITFVVCVIFPPMAFVGIPLVLWVMFGADALRLGANTKHTIHQSLLANNAKDVRWLLSLSASGIETMSHLQSLIAERRISQLKATFQGRIKELAAIGASGELAAKVAARAQQYAAALIEADIMEKAIQVVVQRHKSYGETLAQDARQGVAYQAFLKATADVEAVIKAHGLGVVDSRAVITANANLLNAKSASLCSSVGCDQPKVKNSAYCVAHTCGNDQCNHPSGAAALKAGDGANKKMVATAVHVGGKWAGTEEPAFNLSLDNAFCGECVSAFNSSKN